MNDSARAEPKLAAIVTSYYHNSHADVIVGRLLEGYTLDGQGERPALGLASLYTDQAPANDKSRQVCSRFQIPLFDSVAGALTLGGDTLAVDGVLLIAEHGDYPKSPSGQTVYPKRRLFAQVAEVFRERGKSVPVFVDKHLADNWEDARWIYDTAARLKVPLMAGSSVPQTWRYPPLDVARDAPLDQVLTLSYHTLDAYGFHGLEALESLAERRSGGETGVQAVQTRTGAAVWQAAEQGVFDRELLKAALGVLRDPRGGDRPLEERVPDPVLFSIEYADGLRAHMLTLNGAVAEWSGAWRYRDSGRVEATLFWTQEERPLMHFTHQLRGLETLFATGRAAWPAERTLLTSGLLDALLLSQQAGGERRETPNLLFDYQSAWNWREPPPPPPGRPLDGP